MDEQETEETWKKLIEQKRLRYQGHWSPQDGVKQNVRMWMKMYHDDKSGKNICQVHFAFGRALYRFDLVDRVNIKSVLTIASEEGQLKNVREILVAGMDNL